VRGNDELRGIMFWECQPFSCSVGERKLMKHFVVRLDFFIEHGNLGVPVRKICASHAIFELLQCRAAQPQPKRRMAAKGAKNSDYLSSEGAKVTG
jgi:hypothetical protein